METQKPVLLEVKGLKKHYPIEKGFFKKVVGQVKAVDGVNFFIREGETLGLVGESGCGKTTTGRLILRAEEPTAGEVFYRKNGELLNLTTLSRKELKPCRRDMQIIFQDPFSSLNPRMTVMDIISEPLMIHGIAKGDELKTRVRELLEAVGLRAQHMNRYPYAFSGGQRQRIGIARALALRPKLIVCDEPVSALDVSIQAQTLNLLEDLQQDFKLTYLFIAHDLSVVEHISDRVAVMYLGNIVELASADELYIKPLHPYTEALLSAVPRTDPSAAAKQRIILAGDVPSPSNPPAGCKFHPRCRYAQTICSQEVPVWREALPDHWVACHLADQLSLGGIESS
jgi:peptide/nickel transport system ATP-binding protein